MLTSLIPPVMLGFAGFLCFLIPIFGYEKDLEWWQARNLYHILIFSVTAFIPLLIRDIIPVFVTALTSLSFFSLYYFMTKKNAIRELYNIMTRKGVSDSERGLYTANTVVLLLLLLIFTWYEPIFFTIGMLVMAIGDSMGEIIGRELGEIEYEITSKKTIRGSLTVFLVSISILSTVLGLSNLLFDYSFLYIILIAILATIIEAVSVKSLDNVLMPYLTVLLLKYPLYDFLPFSIT